MINHDGRRKLILRVRRIKPADHAYSNRGSKSLY